jgi:hypothetical protein
MNLNARLERLEAVSCQPPPEQVRFADRELQPSDLAAFYRLVSQQGCQLWTGDDDLPPTTPEERAKFDRLMRAAGLGHLIPGEGA